MDVTQLDSPEIDEGRDNTPPLEPGHGTVDIPPVSDYQVIVDAPDDPPARLDTTEVIPTTPERLRTDFMDEVIRRADVDIPSDVFNEYKQIMLEHFLDPLFDQYSRSISEQVREETRDRGADTLDEYAQEGDRVHYDTIARFRGDRNAAAGDRSSMGTSVFEEAAAFAARITRHLASDRFLAGTTRLAEEDLPHLLGILRISVPRILATADEAENNDNEDYIHVMQIITGGEVLSEETAEDTESEDEAQTETEVEAELSSETDEVATVDTPEEGAEPEPIVLEEADIQRVINYLSQYNASYSSLRIAQESAEERGLHHIALGAEEYEASAVLSVLTTAQKEQIIEHILENQDQDNYDIVRDLILYSSDLTERMAANLFAPYAANTGVPELLTEIISQSDTVEEQMAEYITAIQTNLAQQSLTNSVNDTAIAMSTVGMLWLGVTMGANALLFLTTGDAGALGFAMTAAAGWTVAWDVLRGREAFTTLADFGSRLIFREDEIQSFNNNILGEAVARLPFRDIDDPSLEAFGNPDVISQLKLTRDLSGPNEFSREVFLTNLRNRNSELAGTEEGEALSSALTQLEQYLGGLSQERADSDLYMLAHAFGQMQIDNLDDLHSDILMPNNIELAETQVSHQAAEEVAEATPTPGVEEPAEEESESSDT